MIDYWTASRDSQNRRTIDPYHLASIDGQYILFAYCHMRQTVREFVPARIRAIEPTETTFDRDPAFNVPAFLADSLSLLRGEDTEHHQVRLRFTGTAVRYVRERLWHPGQTMETTPSGDLIVRFDVSHLGEALRMVLTWSPESEALEPPELRAQVAKALAEAAALHARPADFSSPPCHRADTPGVSLRGATPE